MDNQHDNFYNQPRGGGEGEAPCGFATGGGDASPHFDVIIVGGGVNGCGIARDCAQRGLKVLLIEKNDFSSGTSGASSQMIHGGLRYLLSDVKTTRLACQDSGYIQKIAPHLIFRIPFLYPVYKNQGHLFLEALETLMECYDGLVELKGGKKHCRLSAKEALALEPGLNSTDLLGAVTFDEWGIDVPRLCFLNAYDAFQHGATVLNHAQVVGVIKNSGRIQGVRYLTTGSAEVREATAQYIVNACGPWVPQLAEMAGVKVMMRPGKGIHAVFDRRLSNVAINAKTIDGREVFLMPYQNVSLLGTTDDDYFGDLDQQRVLKEEVDYLVEAISHVFPAIKQARMTHSWSGVRPTLYARNQYEDDLSREHEIIDHEKLHDMPGFISMIGGKLASYRIMAEEMTDLLCSKMGKQKKCQTHVLPLPGGDNVPDLISLADKYQLDPYLVSRLIFRHGSKAVGICELMQEDPSLRMVICNCEPITKAELLSVMQKEHVVSLEDIKRRTRLALGPCQGMNCLLPAAVLLMDSHKIDCHLKEVDQFREKSWPGRAVVLDEGQMLQDYLSRSVFYLSLGVESS